MARRRTKRIRTLPGLLALAALVCLAFFILMPWQEDAPSAYPPSGDEILEVTALDVGQADCVLLRLGESVMLVDAGGGKTAENLVSKLQAMGVDKIDILIGTHPHEDHIGGMEAVIRAFTVESFYMPLQPHTTRVYEDVLDAALDAGLSLGSLKAGDSLSFGSAEIHVLAPLRDEYKSLNNASIVCRVDYAGRSVMLTGDAEELSEGEMLRGGGSLRADVLKVGHHGSDTSTSDEFLAAVRPSFAVISCGEGNSYGHPSGQTLNKLMEFGTDVYRTDVNGSVAVYISPGGEIEVICER